MAWSYLRPHRLYDDSNYSWRGGRYREQKISSTDAHRTRAYILLLCVRLWEQIKYCFFLCRKWMAMSSDCDIKSIYLYIYVWLPIAVEHHVVLLSIKFAFMMQVQYKKNRFCIFIVFKTPTKWKSWSNQKKKKRKYDVASCIHCI